MNPKNEKYFHFLGLDLNVNFALTKKEKVAATKKASKLASD
ncbi:MAG: hypothetical protein RR852_17365 [Comamonas sp.]